MKYAAALFLSVGILAVWCNAGILNDRDFAVSIDYSFSEQTAPAVTAGLGGHFLVVWTDYRSGHGDIFGQLYDSTDVPRGANFLINDDGRGAWQNDVDAASDWLGRYYVVWRDYRNGAYPFGPDIYYQRLDSLGFLDANFNISDELPDSSHQSPTIAAAGSGKTVSGWSDLRYQNWDIFARQLGADGTPAGPSVRVNDDLSPSPQHEPAIAISPEGWFVIAWYDGRSGNGDIFMQKFDSTGNAIGNNVKVNQDNGTTHQKFPDIAISGNGTIMLVWTDWRDGPYPLDPDIYSQRFTSNLVRLGPNNRINSTGVGTVQRDPRIASDRMGNFLVVWSDSSSGDWNIKRQMVNHAGAMTEGNLQVNSESLGRQILPDVALDGYQAYIVWSDNRNGNFDIYGRCIQYNDPGLLARPSPIVFTRDAADPNPAPIAVAIENRGYGEISYRLDPQDDWIAVSDSAGSTPDTVMVSIDADGFPIGEYTGAIRLIDETHGDSSVVIPVQLSITGPLVAFSVDSVTLLALADLGTAEPATAMVLNEGTGDLQWRARSLNGWLAVTPEFGYGNSLVTISADIIGLDEGSHIGGIEFSDSLAVNSPETLLVVLDLMSDMAYLDVDTAILEFEVYQGQVLPCSVTIHNLGNVTADWQATTTSEWISLSQATGSDDDLLLFSIVTDSVPPGVHSNTILIEDSLSYNKSIALDIHAYVNAPDTVWSPSIVLSSAVGGEVPLMLTAVNDLHSAAFEFIIDTAATSLDTIIDYSDQWPDGYEINTVYDVGSCRISLLPLSDSCIIPAGDYQLLSLFVTTRMMADSTLEITSGLPCYVETGDRLIYRPQVRFGSITLDDPTDIDGPASGIIPGTFELGQNYPNPFNNNTRIDFSLDRAARVEFVIYNILGQRVAVLADRRLAAGTYTAWWDGCDDLGQPVSSGIFFYRLQADDKRAVKKLVLLK